MDFQQTDIQSEIRDLARKFAMAELFPSVSEDDENEVFRPENIQKLGQLGLTGIPVSDRYQGAGLGYLEYVLAIEEIAAVHAAYAISVAVTGLTQVILEKFAKDEQKERFIPPLATGHAIGAFSLSEAFSGSDAGGLRTTAKKVSGGYELTGTKLWTTQGDSAETILLFARTGEAGPKGLTAFVVQKGMEGFTLGKREKKLGCGSSHTMELILDRVKVPEENRVGAEGEGFKIAMTALDSGRITIAATSLGIARGAFETALSHANERHQFGQKIADFQGVSFLLADMAKEIEASRLLIQQAAWLRDNGKPFSKQAAFAKLFSTDSAMKITTDAVQILGGSGYTKDFPVERYMREAKMMQIVEGTNQIQRHVIAKSLLKERGLL